MVKKLLFAILAIIALSVLVSCTKPEDRIKGNAQIDWVDFIKMNGKTYESIHTAILSDPAKVKESIGEVKFKVAEVVGNPEYRTQDGDAAFLSEGTKIYALEGYSDYSLVAAKDVESLNGYKLYFERNKNTPYKWNYKDMPKDRVNKIHIYTFQDYREQKLSRQIKDANDIKSFIDLLDKGVKADNLDFSEFTNFNMVFYTNEIYAYKYMLYADGNNFYWSPWDTMKLPEEINTYVK